MEGLLIIFLFVTTVYTIGFVNCSVLPVEKCNLEDSACLVPVVQKYVPVFSAGIPEFEVDVLDVMKLDDVAFDLAGLQFTLKEGQMKGLKDAIIDDVKWDKESKKIFLVYHLPLAILKGHYTAGGRVLILPITGDGIMKLKAKNLQINYVLDYKIVKAEDGKEHVAPTKYSITFEVKDNAHFNMTNLFNGNKDLGEAMLQFLNNNWVEVTKEFGKPLVDAAAKVIFRNIQKFFKNIPIEDLMK